MDCLFCKITRGEISAEKVYEDAYSFAFLDIKPNNPGHTLLVPKTHARNILDIKEETLCNIMPALKKLSRAVKEAMQADGLNIAMNNEKAAGQIIFHAHIHIIPRFEGDGHKHFEKRPYKNEAEMKNTAKKIRATI